MTTINRTMYPVQTSMSLIGKMQARYAQLQTQLATGKKASTLAELGTDRYADLSLRSRISRLDGYKSSIDMVNTRLDMLDTIVSRLDTVESDARSLMTPSSYGSSNVNFGTVPEQAKASLDETLSLLNSDIDGRYLFSGGKTDGKAVEGTSTILDGAGGKAGFKQVAAERLAADQGDDGLGRLDLSVASDTVTLAEDGVHPFGFKLSTLTSTSGAVTLTSPSGSPSSLSVKFDAVPSEGQAVTLGLTMPDGTEQTITLKAVTGTPGAGEFQIGADANATAANFKASLEDSLTTAGKTELVAASNFAAADNFFNGQGESVQRVVGPDFAHATALAAADPTNTVIWYKGDDAADARASVTARIDDVTSVSYGVQANESGTAALVRSLAVLSIQSFTNADATSTGRYDAVAERNLSRLSEEHNNEPGSIEMLGAQLGNAQVAVSNVSSRQTTYRATLENMLYDLESVDDETVTMELLALQTRLSATYETTSAIAQLSLVNYLK